MKLIKRYSHYFLFLPVCALAALPHFAVSDDTKRCVDCHDEIYRKWQTSHHAKAMQATTPEVVLGNFKDTQANHFGQQAKFTVNNSGYFAEISYWKNNTTFFNKSYRIEYAFGFYPLQQYLVETENGRLQVLPFAWDSREKAEGGQRWMHLYPEEEIAPNDRLHWRQPLQNWNGMCADCHLEGFKRNYSTNENKFDSEWTELNVGCGACHDSMARDHHSKQANSILSKPGSWTRAEGAVTAQWVGKKPETSYMDACFACHSLRKPLTNGFTSNRHYLDQFSPSFPSPPLYYADGQIKDEVYVFGSFLQSKMHHSGVGCIDCHDAHSYNLKATGNDVCTQCHSVEIFDTTKHHKHPLTSAGSQCVNCHMPKQVYMNVDWRRDHSFRIPRPELSKEFGVPNACQQCHEDQDVSRLIEKTAALYPKRKKVSPDVYTFIATMSGKTNDVREVLAVATKHELPPIKRAALIERLPELVQTLPGTMMAQLLDHENALIRLAAVRASSVLVAKDKRQYLSPRLSDQYRAIRVAAAEHLLGINLSVDHQPAFDLAFKELSTSAKQSQWRGEGRLNEGLRLTRAQQFDEAIKAYRQAISIDPYFAPSYVNLTDLYRSTGHPDKAEELYKQALKKLPNSAILHYSAGLHYVRQKQLPIAILKFKRAKELASGEPQYAYMYYLAVHALGDTSTAYCGLAGEIEKYRNNGDLKQLLISFQHEMGKALPRCNNPTYSN